MQDKPRRFEVGEYGPEKITVAPLVGLIEYWSRIVKDDRIKWFENLRK